MQTWRGTAKMRMRVSRRGLLILGIVAAICAAVLVFILVRGLNQDVGAAARRIWNNTVQEGSKVARTLRNHG